MIAYCGLVCTECPALIATQKDDDEMLKRVWARFDRELNVSLRPEEWVCDGCQAFGGHLASYCREGNVSACAIDKEVHNCAHCHGYPCQKLESFFAIVPHGKAALERMRQSLWRDGLQQVSKPVGGSS